jgi:hypothetical protein
MPQEPLALAQVGLVQLVRVRRVEDGDARLERRTEGGASAIVIALAFGRQPHASESDAHRRAPEHTRLDLPSPRRSQRRAPSTRV